MIDTLHRNLERARQSRVLERLKLRPAGYCAMTMHRPSNVDRRETLEGIIGALEEIQERLPIVFPAHPRTRARLKEFGLEEPLERMPNVVLTEPLGYVDFLQLYSNSRLVLTDSGGIQEETTALGIPCLTMRDTTERPITVTHGTNRVVGSDPAAITREALEAIERPPRECRVPELWDGKTAPRIVDALEQARAGFTNERRA
jgi:UDP-N-acetylglucosamine 2-epimerase (non-hydrolysing)